ncbi:MAG: BrnA antitoxin family protein [Alphaproteobacteria bacterium]|nr:BrnA antitoxin family protein [Alphaproteobacteria bacterium]
MGKQRREPKFGIPDEENPEWTTEDFRLARPVKQAMPELIEAAKRARGRPRLASPKQHVSLRLDPMVLAGFKAMGPGWQKQINDTLARALARARKQKPVRATRLKRAA